MLMIQVIFYLLNSFSAAYIILSGSSISTGSERRAASAYNAIKWADLQAGPGWEMALWLPLYAFAWKFAHRRNFDPTLVDFSASLAITCMWKGAGRFQLPEGSRNEGNTKWEHIMVLTELSHNFYWFTFCKKTKVLCRFYAFGKQMHLGISADWTKKGKNKHDVI